MRRRIVLATAVSGALFVVFFGFAAMATWGHWGHAELVLEAVACILSGVCCALGAAVLCADCLRAAALDGVAAQVAAALLADPFLHDPVVRQLADTLVAYCRTPEQRQARQPRHARKTRPFEVVRPIEAAR